MILTRTYLNPRRAGARKLLGSPQAMHAAVLAGFPPDTDGGRVLWRVDGENTHNPTLYIVSAAQPDLAHVDEQAGWPSRRLAESTHYDPFLNRLQAGQTWGFRLTANPTHRAKIGDRSKVLAHVTVAQQTQWLLDRAEVLGIALEQTVEDEGHGTTRVPTVGLVGRNTLRFRRQQDTVTLSTATFTGSLVVVDADRLRQALVSGVGRAKAYGCGLMTLGHE